MSDAPQGMFSFPGVKTVLSGSFTLSHGISPSMATIYMAPQKGWVAKQGPLTISYGSLQLKFEDCVADRMEAQRSGSGELIWVLHLLDRRWKWRKCGRISGYYNVRRGFGEEAGSGKIESIVKGTEKSAKELAKLCLDEMDEDGYDISALPTEAYPAIEWDYALPAEALSQLCDLFGCRVVLHLNGRVKVEKVGVGGQLALGTTGLDGGIAVDSPEIPDRLIVVSAPIRWQYDFDLEPVGLDVDGSIKLIDDLSYTPTIDGTKGWGKADVPAFNCLAVVIKPDTPTAKTTYDTLARQLAQQSVYRWYRIQVKAGKQGYGSYAKKDFKPIKLSPYKEEIDDLERMLPIEDRQIVTHKIGNRVEPLPAWVWGKFHNPRCETPESQFEKLLAIGAEVQKYKTIYTEGFSIDREQGIVRFSEPVFLYDEKKSWEYMPAEIRLRTTVSLRDKDTRGWLRKEFKQVMPGPPRNTFPQYLRHDDIAYNVNPLGDKSSESKVEAEKAAKYYLEAAVREYQTTEPSNFTYAGFQKIDVDGAIQQVTWNLGDDGYATTRASRNREELIVTPSYQERRTVERLNDWLALGRLTTSQQQQAMQRARA